MTNTAVSMPPAISATLADYAAAFTLDAVPAAVRARATHLMLDALGIALASTRYDFARQTLAGLVSLGDGGGEVPVIGHGLRLGLRDAAVMNGFLIHGLDFDDTHPRGVIHATTSVLPAALSVAVRQNATGTDLLAAYVLGMELTTRISAAAKGAFHKVGFHPTGLVGTFGAAMTAAKLLGLDAGAMAHAQGIALSLASGNLEFLQDGAGTKRLHPGWAASSGITAAALAQHGMTGPRATYEGRFGLYASHLGALAAECDLDSLTAGLGSVWETLDVAIKPLPACHFTHACADAASALNAQWLGLQAQGVTLKRIVARVPAGVMPVVCEPIEHKRRPQNAYDAQFSIPYAVATGLRFGRFTLDALEADAIGDPLTLALAAQVDCVVDADANFPRYYPGEVILELSDGRTLRHNEPINRGAPGRPISHADIAAKFHDNAARAVPRAHADHILNAVLGMEQTGARALADLLGTAFH